MRLHEYQGQPSWKENNCVNLVDDHPIDIGKIMRIGEILVLLGFLHSRAYFGEFHLGFDPTGVELFVRGELDDVQPHTVHHLRLKLNAVHNMLASEIADAKDVDELWKAQARYNLLQTAFAHLT